MYMYVHVECTNIALSTCILKNFIHSKIEKRDISNQQSLKKLFLHIYKAIAAIISVQYQ